MDARKATKTRMIRHISLFRLHDDVDDAARYKALTMLRDLRHAVPGIMDWQVELSLDARKGQIIVQNSLFLDGTALQAYRASDKHKPVVRFMADISDWWIGDYEI